MFICTELIEETGKHPEVIFGMWGYFSLARTSLSLGYDVIVTFFKVLTVT